MPISKRLLDLVGALFAGMALGPILLGITLVLRVTQGRPILFSQVRVGRGGELFRILKFRTMSTDNASGRLFTVEGDERVTSIGRVLRRYKLDELPQLWNVLRGEMSLVGPRPEVPKYVRLYTDEQRQVLRMVPGITDRASIVYRHEEKLLDRSSNPEAVYVKEIMPDKIRINLEYAWDATFWSDLTLLYETIAAVFRRGPEVEGGEHG